MTLYGNFFSTPTTPGERGRNWGHKNKGGMASQAFMLGVYFNGVEDYSNYTRRQNVDSKKDNIIVPVVVVVTRNVWTETMTGHLIKLLQSALTNNNCVKCPFRSMHN